MSCMKSGVVGAAVEGHDDVVGLFSCQKQERRYWGRVREPRQQSALLCKVISTTVVSKVRCGAIGQLTKSCDFCARFSRAGRFFGLGTPQGP